MQCEWRTRTACKYHKVVCGCYPQTYNLPLYIAWLTFDKVIYVGIQAHLIQYPTVDAMYLSILGESYQWVIDSTGTFDKSIDKSLCLMLFPSDWWWWDEERCYSEWSHQDSGRTDKDSLKDRNTLTWSISTVMKNWQEFIKKIETLFWTT